MTDLSEPNNHLPERVTRLETLIETVLPHLATQADLEKAKSEIKDSMREMETRLNGKLDRITWALIGMVLTLAATGVALYGAIK